MEGNKLFVPASIVVAGLVIAGAIFFTKDKEPTISLNEDGTQLDDMVAVDPVTDRDHIRGNPDAEVVIIEYSDLECPFCARFHRTMEQIMSEYETSGQVAWVYRHFPLDNIHRQARPAAEATECVAELAGKDAFWDYTSLLFDDMPASLSTENLRVNAESLGVDGEAFTSCVDSGRHADFVESQFQSGMLLAQADPQFGTPYSIILTKDGSQIVIPGAQPYNVVKQVIDTLLAGDTE